MIKPNPTGIKAATKNPVHETNIVTKNTFLKEAVIIMPTINPAAPILDNIKIFL